MSSTPAKEAKRSDQVLARILSIRFVQLVCPDQTGVQTAILRDIILQNILGGRVRALLRIERAHDERLWLMRYAPRVAGVYATERTNWLLLVRDASGITLYERIYEIVRNLEGTLQARYHDVPVEIDDVAHETFCDLHIRRNLLKFPFDTLLNNWVRQRIELSARQLYAPQKSPSTPRFAYMLNPHDLCETIPDDHAVTDSGLEQLALFSMAKHLDRDAMLLISHTYRGVPVSQTATQLNIGIKTVYGRRQRLISHIRAMLSDQFAENSTASS